MALKSVYFDGPHSKIDPVEGTESPYWIVYIGEEFGDAIGKVYTCFDYDRAATLASSIARDRRLNVEESANRVHGAW